MNVPEHLGCAQCGKPLSWHNSFGLTVPLDQSRVKPSDFCDLECIAAWCRDMAEAVTRKPQ